MKTYITFLLAWIINFTLSSQRTVALELNEAIKSQSETCYDISIRSKRSEGIALGGQNYRFFYDVDELQFNKDKVQSHLNTSAYSSPEIEHAIKGGIGFLSVSVNAFQHNDYTTLVGHKSSHTLSICFNGTSKKDQDLIWADPTETNAFASAEIVITEWNKSGYQDVLVVEELNKNTSQEISENPSDISVYPNPTDGILQYNLKNT